MDLVHLRFMTHIPIHRRPVCRADVSWSMSLFSVSFLTHVLCIISRYVKHLTKTDLLVLSQTSGLRSLTNSPWNRNSQRPPIPQWLERRNSNRNSVVIRFFTSHPQREKGKFQLWFPKYVHCTVLVCKADIYVYFLRQNVNIHTFFSQPLNPIRRACMHM